MALGVAQKARLQATLIHEAYELQADCFTGATLQGAINDGTLIFEPGDQAKLAAAITALADMAPWGSTTIDAQGRMQTETHGDAQQRIANYKLGVDKGENACLKLA